MLASLVQSSLSQRLLVILLALLLTGCGVRALMNIPIDAFPDISPTQVKIIIRPEERRVGKEGRVRGGEGQ